MLDPARPMFPVRNAHGWTGYAQAIPGRPDLLRVEYCDLITDHEEDLPAAEWEELPVCAYCQESELDGAVVTDGCCAGCYLGHDHLFDLMAEAV